MEIDRILNSWITNLLLDEIDKTDIDFPNNFNSRVNRLMKYLA